MKKLTALALASAAFVATPAQAASVFSFTVTGTWAIDDIYYHPLGDTIVPTVYETSALSGYFDQSTGLGMFDVPGASGPAWIQGLNSTGNTLIVYGVPSAHGYFGLTLTFDHDLAGALPDSTDGFVSGYFNLYAFAANYRTQTVTGEATLTAASRVEVAVPEPATWAMMIAGFGLAGAALRTRRVRVAHA